MIEVTKISNQLTEFRLKGGYSTSQKWLLISDVHYDSTHCNRKLLKKHLETAKEENRKVFINGDWFDVMGCHGDPRSKPQDIRPEYYSKRPYLDLVLEDSYNFLKEYADNIAFIGYGNHETSINRRHDTDILERLHYLLSQHNDKIILGEYSGFVKFKFEALKGGGIKSVMMHYHHGYGGNAKRSKGMLDSQIAGFMYPDADIIIRGHDHMKWHDPSNVRLKVKDSGDVVQTAQHIVKTGSYKDGLENSFGWENSKGFMPTKLGGWFMDLTYSKKGVKIEFKEAQ